MRRWIRSHLTYANVTTTILLFLVLGGGSAYALAGSNTVFSDDIVNGQVKTQDMASPPSGPVFARIQNLGGSSFVPVSGVDTSHGIERNATMTSPAASFDAGQLAVRLTYAPTTNCPEAPNCARTFTLRVNGKDTPVSCTVTGVARTCDSGDASVRIPAQSLVSIKHTFTGSSGTSGGALISWVASEP